MTLPKKIKIVEVGPRDGFQSIKPWIDTSVKVEIIRMLLDAGVDLIEGVSFISAKAIPQMQDAEEVINIIKSDVDLSKVLALAANEKGVLRAHEAGVRMITLVISASEAHNLNNVRKTPAESLEQLEKIISDYPDIHIKLSLATAFGCPFIGNVPNEKLFFVLDKSIELGVRDICLCDTIGVANPLQTKRILHDLKERYPQKEIEWSLHLHNTRGLAAANTLEALYHGIDRFETAIAGLGGCPFAPGASGNMATEDLVYMVREMGIDVNADILKLIRTTEFISQKIGCCADSKISSVTVNKIKSQ